jgi:hypothetical protein
MLESVGRKNHTDCQESLQKNVTRLEPGRWSQITAVNRITEANCSIKVYFSAIMLRLMSIFL